MNEPPFIYYKLWNGDDLYINVEYVVSCEVDSDERRTKVRMVNGTIHTVVGETKNVQAQICHVYHSWLQMKAHA